MYESTRKNAYPDHTPNLVNSNIILFSFQCINPGSKVSLDTHTSRAYKKSDASDLIWGFIYTHDHNVIFSRAYTFLLNVEMPKGFHFHSLLTRG